MKMQKKNKRFLDGKDLKGTPWISKNKSDEILKRKQERN